MTNLKIKVQYRNTVIAFQDSGVVLKERSQKQLIDLALLAHGSGDPTIMRLFENLPSAAELKRMKMQLLEEA